jgi:uncharacterized protein (TIGR02391 family)
MTVLGTAIPDPEALLAMEPEELGGVILHHIDRYMPTGPFHRQHVDYFDHGAPRHPKHELVINAISEAVQWLEVAGFLMPAPGANGPAGWRDLTRRGRRLKESGTALQYRSGALLPREMIHAKLNIEAWPLFIKGQHDLAVFAAFKAVEIAVRDASGLDESWVGEKLMRKAFNKEDGVLADEGAQDTEVKSFENMIAGAFGCIRNPVGHRDVGLDASKGSAEMIVLASYFLRVVDDRRAKIAAAKKAGGA